MIIASSVMNFSESLHQKARTAQGYFPKMYEQQYWQLATCKTKTEQTKYTETKHISGG